MDTIAIGERLRDSTVRHVKQQRKDGRNGVRVTLADGRSAWGRPNEKAIDLVFERRGS